MAFDAELNKSNQPDLGALEVALDGRKVTPAVPSGRTPHVGANDLEPFEIQLTERDNSSSWSVYVGYQNAKGERSERRITCKKLMGYGRVESVFAYCHESGMPKSFRIDRMTDLVDLTTGELLDPLAHFEHLHLHGLMPIEDKALADFARMLVFMARCDGQYHPLEEEALERAFTGYCLRFGGDDRTVEEAIGRAARLAPDADDVLTSIRRISNFAEGSKLSRLVLDHTKAIIDADGMHADEEVVWAMRVTDALKAIAGRP